MFHISPYDALLTDGGTAGGAGVDDACPILNRLYLDDTGFVL